MKRNFDRHKEKVITLLSCGLLITIVLSVLALLSGAVMKLFGFEYKSVGSVILFFIVAAILSYPLSLIASALPKALLSLNKLSIQEAKLLYVFLDTFATYWGLRITDYFMPSVSVKDISIVVVALIFALLCMSDIETRSKDDE